MKKPVMKTKSMPKEASKTSKSKDKKDKVKETKPKENKTVSKATGREDPAFKQAYRDWYMGKLSL